MNVRWWALPLICLAWQANAQSVAETSAATAAPLPSKAVVDARLDRLYGAHQPYADFLAALQKAVAADDRPAVANLVHYPFSTMLAARRKVLKTPKAFLARYDDIMTPKVRAAIAAQTYETLFSNSNGLMIGSGQVWFTGKCVDATCAKPARIGISAINH
ncbi:hypothetical protein [Pigmentiphaga litoralis]|uniref:hypothetical protein n=1 Tax=Pigmentiphaga litoralis TaxID=516702 RepID=UPI003B43D355